MNYCFTAMNKMKSENGKKQYIQQLWWHNGICLAHTSQILNTVNS